MNICRKRLLVNTAHHVENERHWDHWSCPSVLESEAPPDDFVESIPSITAASDVDDQTSHGAPRGRVPANRRRLAEARDTQPADGRFGRDPPKA